MYQISNSILWIRVGHHYDSQMSPYLLSSVVHIFNAANIISFSSRNYNVPTIICILIKTISVNTFVTKLMTEYCRTLQ